MKSFVLMIVFAVLVAAGCVRGRDAEPVFIGTWKSADISDAKGLYHYTLELRRTYKFHVYASREIGGGLSDLHGRFDEDGTNIYLRFIPEPGTATLAVVKLTHDELELDCPAYVCRPEGRFKFRRQ